MRKIGLCFLAFCIVFSGMSLGAWPLTAYAAATDIRNLTPLADAHVHGGGNAGNNYGAQNTLIVGAGRDSYLRFDLSELPDSKEIESVKLNYYQVSGGPNTIEVYRVEQDSWDEAAVTWNTKPTPDETPIISYTAAGLSKAVIQGTVDITEVVRSERAGDGTLTLMLTTAGGASPGVNIASKEMNDAANHPNAIAPTLVVTSQLLNDEERAEADAGALDMLGMDQATVTDNVDLPQAGSVWGSTITWSSDKPDIIGDNGEVQRPRHDEADATVVLTAIIAYQSDSVTRSYTLFVPKSGQDGQLTDYDRVQADSLALDQLGLGTAAITEDLALPTTGTNGSDIQWSSDKPEVISPAGTVQRPSATLADELVTLTAVVAYGEQTMSRSFSVTVSKVELYTVLKLPPLADAHVQSGGNAGTNFGSANTMVVGAGRESYVRYDLSAIPGPYAIDKATLDYYQVSGGANTIEVYRVGEDGWSEASISWNTKPDADGTLIRAYAAGSVSKARIEGIIDVTEAVRAEKSIDDMLSFMLTTPGGASPGINIASKEMNDAANHPNAIAPTLTVTLVNLTDSERVAEDIHLLDEWDEIAVTENVALPVVGKRFSSIAWSSSHPSVIAADGTVTRPGEDELDAVVELTATVTYGSATMQRVIVIRVPKLPSASPFIQESLGRLVELAEDTLDDAAIGNDAGEYPQAAKDIFAAQIADAALTYANPEAEHRSAVLQLLGAGKAFLNTAVLSDAIVDEKTNARQYSEHRRELVALVWEAQAALLIEPELYTDGAKIALQDQLDRAIDALNGDYSAPFERNREFLQPRPDEDLQFVTEYFSRAPSYGSATYGLRPALKWYKAQHVFSDAYHTVEILPEADAFVNRNSANTNYGTGDGLVINRPLSGQIYVTERSPVMRFDLSGLSDMITNATFRYTNKKADNNPIFIHLLDDDNWSETTINYNALQRDENNNLIFGQLIGQGMLGAQNAFSTIDLTDAAVREQLSDGKLSILITQIEGASFPGEFFSKEAAVVDRRPRLVTKVDAIDHAKLLQYYNKMNTMAVEMAAGAVAGNSVGHYPAAAVNRLNAAIASAQTAVQSNLQYGIGESIVELSNAMKFMREQQVHRSDIEPASNIFFPAGEIEELRNRIAGYPLLAGEFAKVKAISDERSLQDVQDYFMQLDSAVSNEELNARFRMWSDVINQNFTPHANAVKAKLEITLPSIENSTDGLGHVWIDNIRIYPSNSGGDLTIHNAGFEQGTTTPAAWETKIIKGNPILSWENRANYAKSGSRSAYLENPTSADEGAWVYQHDIPIVGGVPHTLTYSSKIDGKLVAGVQVKLVFLDVNDNQVGAYTNTSNMKASVGADGANLRFQADAIVYAVTGDITYAQKAKYNMLYFLNDHAQGIESWLVYNRRPDGLDAYGAVQTGRNAASLASAYTLIKDAGVFNAQEKEQFMKLVDYLLRNMSDLRDRMELTDYEAQVNTGNWETDMSAGTSFLAMAFPELPNARQWLHNGRIVLEGQLKYTLAADGSWPESIRYHVAAIQRFSAYAKALRNVTGEDWFRDSVLKDMFEFLMLVQTPPYEQMQDRISTPSYGDHILTPGTDFAMLGIYFNEIAATNPELGALLYETWIRAGRPVANYWGEAIALENFFNPVEFSNTMNASLQLESTDALTPAGLYLFRQNFARPNETYMALIANATPIGHGHYDQGSFLLYANGKPLIMDPGIESYFDTSKNWYVGSSSHSTVQFGSAGNYVNTPLISQQLDFHASHGLDLAKVQVNHPNGASQGTQVRSMAYVKNGIDAFIIWDQMKGSAAAARYNLPIAASSTTINGNKAVSSGHYGTDLETTVLQPANADIQQENGRAHPAMLPNSAELNYLRVAAGAGENFLTVLYPKQSGEEGLITEPLSVAASDVSAYKLTDPEGNYVIVAVNNGNSAQSIVLAANESMVEMRTGTAAVLSAGNVTLQLQAGSMHVWKPASLADGVPTTIEVTGESSLSVPQSGSNTYAYKADVIDQYADLMTNEAIQWSIVGSPAGVTVNERGIVTVTAVATAATVQLRAASGDASELTLLTLNASNKPDPDPNPNPGNDGNPSPSDNNDSEAQVTKQSDGTVSIVLPTPANAAANARVKWVLTQQALNDALTLSSATRGDIIALELPAVNDSTGVQLELPAAFFANKRDKKLIIKTAAGTVELTDTMLSTLSVSDGSTIELVMEHVDSSSLNYSDRREIENKPVISIYIMINGERIAWSNSHSPVKISIPYTPTASEESRTSKLTVWHIHDDGAITAVPNGRYDAGTGAITFSTKHFSVYAVAFVNKSFRDLNKHEWARESVETLAAKGIVNGVSADSYNPAASVTRADFVKLLVNTLELEADTTTNFSDVSATDYYAREVGIAGALGIVLGKGGNRFDPKAPITRQDMIVMTARALQLSGHLNAPHTTDGLEQFKDSTQVAAYAAQPASALIRQGLVHGSGDYLNPLGTTTRAETAVLMYRIYQLN